MTWNKPVLVLLLSGALSGCLFRNKPAAAPAPPPLPSPVRPAPPEPMAPPVIDPPAPAWPEGAAPQAPQRDLPPAPPLPAPRRRPVRATPAPAAAPKEPAEEEPAGPEPSLQLGEVIPAELRVELRRVLNEAVGEARQALGRLDGSTLSSEQQQTAARIRAFLTQAESLAETDLRSAAELARRAVLLARDLLRAVR